MTPRRLSSSSRAEQAGRTASIPARRKFQQQRHREPGHRHPRDSQGTCQGELTGTLAQ